MPFLKNTWYIFALSEEITHEAFVHRKIAGEDLLVYRQTDGTLAAIHDLCPHRFVPLHMGRQVGDTIQCGYHGLEFGADGRCVKNPVLDAPIPGKACVRSYPVIERDTIVWIWLGDPDSADAALVPDYGFLSEPGRRNVGGYLHTRANYQLSTDNLLDLTHVQFVHRSLQASEAFERLEFRVEQDTDSVTTWLTFPSGRPGPLFQKFLDPETPLDLTFELRWNPPSCCRLRVTGNPPGESDKQIFETMSAHIVSPETEETSHYFYINSRTHDLDKPETDQALRDWQEQGFNQEDKPMLEAQQRFLGKRDLMSLEPVGLRTDGGALRARRLLTEKINLEQAAAG